MQEHGWVAALGLVIALGAAGAGLAQNSFNVGGTGGGTDPATQQPQVQLQPAPQPAQPQIDGFGPKAADPAAQPQPQPKPKDDNPELADFGVPPTPDLHPGPPHGPTPNSIPGGQVVTTVGVKALVSGQYGPFVLLDVLGGDQGLPNAVRATPAAEAGSYQDQIQQRYGQFLEQVTQGRKDVPIVTYCLSPECWMSYNAALRAINLGYTNVLWYRGGITAWQQDGGALTSLP